MDEKREFAKGAIPPKITNKEKGNVPPKKPKPIKPDNKNMKNKNI